MTYTLVVRVAPVQRRLGERRRHPAGQLDLRQQQRRHHASEPDPDQRGGRQPDGEPAHPDLGPGPPRAACCPTSRSRSRSRPRTDRGLRERRHHPEQRARPRARAPSAASSQTFKATDFVFNTYTDGSLGMQMTKTSSVPLATPVSPGDHPHLHRDGDEPGHGDHHADRRSPSTTRCPPESATSRGSGSVTCELTRETCATSSTTRSTPAATGTDAWATDWVENRRLRDRRQRSPRGGAAGYVAVTGNALQLRYLRSNVRDNFDTDGSYAGNRRHRTAGAPTGPRPNDDGNAGRRGRSQVDRQSAPRQLRNGRTVGGVHRPDGERHAVRPASRSTSPSRDSGIDAGETVVAEYSIDGRRVRDDRYARRRERALADRALPSTSRRPADTSLRLRFRSPRSGAPGPAVTRRDIDDVEHRLQRPRERRRAPRSCRTVNLIGATRPDADSARLPRRGSRGRRHRRARSRHQRGRALHRQLAVSTGGVSGAPSCPLAPGTSRPTSRHHRRSASASPAATTPTSKSPQHRQRGHHLGRVEHVRVPPAPPELLASADRLPRSVRTAR